MKETDRQFSCLFTYWARARELDRRRKCDGYGSWVGAGESMERGKRMREGMCVCNCVCVCA